MHSVHENALRQNLKHNQLFCKSTTTPKLQLVIKLTAKQDTHARAQAEPSQYKGEKKFMVAILLK